MGSYLSLLLKTPEPESILSERFHFVFAQLKLISSFEWLSTISSQVFDLSQDRLFLIVFDTTTLLCITDVALVGGGSYPQPGEISLAHNGVLFLDELPEYKRSVLEVMRQPLEDRTVTISRAKFTVDYPANFILVAAMNPCPCGYYNHPERDCTCSSGTVQRYLNKVSGPLLDRIDLHVEVTPVDYEDLSSTMEQEGSTEIRERVLRAREVQCKRFLDRNSLKDESNCLEDVPLENFNARVSANAEMESRHLRRYCQLDKASGDLIKNAMNKLGLSARAYDKILKVARTIADLDMSADIQVKHVAEAIQCRSLDRSML